MDLQDAGALVSGGASGLGAATVRRLHAAGAFVVAADLNVDKGKALAGRARPGGFRFVEANVTDSEAVEAAGAIAAEAPARPAGSRSAAPGSAGPSGSPARTVRTRSTCFETWSRST